MNRKFKKNVEKFHFIEKIKEKKEVPNHTKQRTTFSINLSMHIFIDSRYKKEVTIDLLANWHKKNKEEMKKKNAELSLSSQQICSFLPKYTRINILLEVSIQIIELNHQVPMPIQKETFEQTNDTI